ncbi:MAG: hypothetical protein GOP50_08890 [Candidatus Heimdallarchaeota archaeon]|nr:hypothetical protein [Candidatus Heimdallarchaeota archaeon]
MLSDIKEIKTNHILPNQAIPSNVDIIITTEIEKKNLDFEKIFVPKAFNRYYLFSNIFLLAKNKNYFNEIVVGIDPGKTTGLAVLAEKEIILGYGEFYTAVDAVKEVITVFFNIETSELIIKVGAGGGQIKDEIVRRLNEIFHDKVPIEVVNEDFTSRKKINRFGKNFSKNVQSSILIALR